MSTSPTPHPSEPSHRTPPERGKRRVIGIVMIGAAVFLTLWLIFSLANFEMTTDLPGVGLIGSWIARAVMVVVIAVLLGFGIPFARGPRDRTSR